MFDTKSESRLLYNDLCVEESDTAKEASIDLLEAALRVAYDSGKADENDACAKIVEDKGKYYAVLHTAKEIAKAIRERGDK